MAAEASVWGLIPAAGSGRRMGVELPKQYLKIGGRSVLEWSFRALGADPRVRGIVVSVAAGDSHWPGIAPRLDRLLAAATGGAERCHSVLNGLDQLARHAGPADWVLVHDAARPCLPAADLSSLIDAVTRNGDGGLLAVPLADTLKRGDAGGHVVETVPRENLWRALTPQMFRLGQLRQALAAALASGMVVTDEAAAMELGGMRPLLVPGQAMNIKITRREDLALARWQLESGGRL